MTRASAKLCTAHTSVCVCKCVYDTKKERKKDMKTDRERAMCTYCKVVRAYSHIQHAPPTKLYMTNIFIALMRKRGLK